MLRLLRCAPMQIMDDPRVRMEEGMGWKDILQRSRPRIADQVVDLDQVNEQVLVQDIERATDQVRDPSHGQEGARENDQEWQKESDEDLAFEQNELGKWFSKATTAQRLADAMADAKSGPDRAKAEAEFAEHARQMGCPKGRLKSIFAYPTKNSQTRRRQVERAVAMQRLTARSAHIETQRRSFEWPVRMDVPEPSEGRVTRFLSLGICRPHASAEVCAEQFFSWAMQQGLCGETWLSQDLAELYAEWSRCIGWWPHDWAQIAKHLRGKMKKGSTRLDGCRLRTYAFPE
jgi:hypothetical protein